MAAPRSVDPEALLEQHLASASPDLLRDMIASFVNAMMSAQADQVRGAGYGERSKTRVNRLNGYRAREWDTRAGTVELEVPKLREGLTLVPIRKCCRVCGGALTIAKADGLTVYLHALLGFEPGSLLSPLETTG